MLVQSATVGAAPTNEVSVSVTLLHDIGAVDPGTLVTFTVQVVDPETP